ncbi:hypothetical protein VTN96DRAFT_2996 [Rasamsonia emersonii]|uniref:30 kDa heat shock protein n=1 Tax=Rasamsonia emersonii (strain ATCC 16479 / CBS 393.64 / IMI 116815) TaxID=1408163 RepID=A0A0F4YQV7_RASE3|nr:30 kDa heat shock protein [Rasamsonia emersonii CBS 393.64]KKA20652.1 30 kDa heat shock protein [Rasamsonia emersonii CBS 393.64]
MAFYPRFSAGDFLPLFRLLDDYDVHRSTRSSSSHRRHHNDHWPTARSFAPRFDVREVNDSYLLDGELPGVQQKDVEIEFTDPHTLVIKGRVEHEYNNDNDNEQDEATANDSSSDDDTSKKSYQPTVEDADDDEATGTNKSTTVIPTSSTPNTTTSTSASSDNRLSKSTKSKDKGKAVQKQPSFKYWVSERSVGEFHRTFTFPTRVNQDAVKASLKNGILSIVVPKKPAHVVKKIRIE